MCIILLTDDGLSNRPKHVEIESILFTYLSVVFLFWTQEFIFYFKLNVMTISKFKTLNWFKSKFNTWFLIKKNHDSLQKTGIANHTNTFHSEFYITRVTGVWKSLCMTLEFTLEWEFHGLRTWKLTDRHTYFIC